jgi:hypothetical protein
MQRLFHLPASHIQNFSYLYSRLVHRLVFQPLKFNAMSNPSVQLNEPVIRIIAFEVAILALSFAFTKLLVIPLFLLFDFYLRGWDMQRFSPLYWLAAQINHYFFQNRYKPVSASPKVFAARLGTIMCLAVIGTYVFESDVLSLGLAVLMGSAALLMSLTGFCVGSYIYNHFQKLRHHLHF